MYRCSNAIGVFPFLSLQSSDQCKTRDEGMDYFDQVDECPDLREGLHEDALAGETIGPKKSSPAEAPGQRLLKGLTGGVRILT